MSDRKLKPGETVMILLLAVIFLGLAYYVFFYTPVQNQLDALSTENLESQIAVEQAKAARKKAMLEEIEAAKQTDTSEIAVYDNIKGEISELYGIFGEGLFVLTFQTPRAKDNLVRRTVSVQYWADSFEEAQELFYQLYDCRYLTLIQSFTFTPQGESFLGGGETKVTLTMIFYETLTGASSTSGLIIEQ